MLAIASTRRWNAGLADRLAARLAQPLLAIRARGELSAGRLQAAGVQTVFVPHWSYIIPAEVFENFECVIFHMTDLPFGRGGSPLQNLIARGFSETVITAIRCTEILDGGPVYLKRPLSLLGTAEEIFIRADRVIEEMVIEIVTRAIKPVPQVGEVVNFIRRQPTESDIAGCKDLDHIYDLIRMLDADGYPSAFVDVGPFRLEFTRASRKADTVNADVRIRLKTLEKA